MTDNERFCGDCPDHEACATGISCEQVKRVNPRLERHLIMVKIDDVWQAQHAGWGWPDVVTPDLSSLVGRRYTHIRIHIASFLHLSDRLRQRLVQDVEAMNSRVEIVYDFTPPEGYTLDKNVVENPIYFGIYPADSVDDVDFSMLWRKVNPKLFAWEALTNDFDADVNLTVQQRQEKGTEMTDNESVVTSEQKLSDLVDKAFKTVFDWDQKEHPVKVLEVGELVEIAGHRFRLTEVYLEHNKPPSAYLTSIIEELKENDNG